LRNSHSLPDLARHVPAAVLARCAERRNVALAIQQEAGEIDLLPLPGEKDVPEPLEPHNSVLM
jgi:hypothetical protein